MKKPIETVAEAERRAKRRLPKAIFDSLVAGSEKGITIHANVEAFDQIGFRPRPVAVRPFQRDLKTNVLGMDLGFPVIVAPAGAQAIDPGGEVAVARASAAVGIPIGVSSFASQPFELVVRENRTLSGSSTWSAPETKSPSGSSARGKRMPAR